MLVDAEELREAYQGFRETARVEVPEGAGEWVVSAVWLECTDQLLGKLASGWQSD